MKSWTLSRWKRLLTVCACALLGACGTLSSHEFGDLASGGDTGQVDIDAEMAALAQPLVERGETVGIVVGVLLPDGTQHFAGYGVTEEHGGQKPDADTLFALGSLSKGFLGAVTAMLVDEGKLSWNDTLGDLLPPDVHLSPDAKNITLSQLTTHTSGLPRQPMTARMLSYFVEFLFDGENFYRNLDREEVLGYLADFKAPAHVVPQYSNIGYAILGYILERRTGLTVDALLDDKLIRPLQLSNTGYTPQSLPGYARRAQGHVGDQPKFIRRGAPVVDWHFTDIMKGSAGLYSSARDLLIFASAYLQRGTPLEAPLADSLRVRLPRSNEAPAVAWVVDQIGEQHIAYQIGFVAGFSGYIGLDVDGKTAVVVLQNSFNWTDKVGHRLLVGLHHARERQKKMALVAEQIESERLTSPTLIVPAPH